MATFQWVISQLDSKINLDGMQDVISCIHWRYQATEIIEDKTYSIDTYGATSIEQPNPQSFVPYADITEAQVIGWLEAVLPITDMQANLNAQIELLKNPTDIVLPNPWIENK